MTGELLRLPRTPEAESAARALVETLEPGEGKMYGVLLAEGPGGVELLKAFSGLGEGQGFVPPIGLGLQPSALEVATLERLAEIRSELALLEGTPAPDWAAEQAALAARHALARQRRAELRLQEGADLAGLERESQTHSRERRELRDAARRDLAPRAARVLDLKHERRRLSGTLQAEMHGRFERVLFQGKPWSLASLFPSGAPTGVGECCAPKLLYAASLRGLRPLGMAEIWWGEARGDRHPGEFYQACAERCQPLLGPLLSGRRQPLQVLYEDEDLLAVDKPPGVLSVPGRGSGKQDCVLTRLGYPDLFPVHRLDMETSGVLLFARNVRAQAALHRQFALRIVDKRYEALLEGCPGPDSGVVDLPVQCGRQKKRAVTRFRVLDRGEARLELVPMTGRTHQLRVHAASLGCPIRGDRLYGTAGGRLLLHARELAVEHPGKGLTVTLVSPVPF